MSLVESIPGPMVTTSPADGVYRHFVHPDIEVLESNAVNGNTDPRFFTIGEGEQWSRLDLVNMNRGMLAAHAGSERLVVMVPQISDGFVDVDEPVVAPKDGYQRWPEEYQPPTDVHYSPDDDLAVMVDLPSDGLITAQPGRALMLNTADCAAVVLYDKALALAHIGREGAARDIGSKMLKALTEKHQTSPRDVRVHIGAAIAAGSYRLSTVPEALRKPEWEPFLKETPHGTETDFVGYAISRLIESGVRGEHITRTTVDVFTNPRWFSHTAANRSKSLREPGRNSMLAMIKQSE